MGIKVVNLEDKFRGIENYWDPKIAGELNNQTVKLAKFKGEFVMHNHQDEDELFLVIDGEIDIVLEDKTLSVKKGEFAIIPKGVNHKPIAKEEAHVLLFEPNSTLNTGDKNNHFTVRNLKKI